MTENGWGKERKMNRETAMPILVAGREGGGSSKTLDKGTALYIIFNSCNLTEP
jgi:hypothetical protein